MRGQQPCCKSDFWEGYNEADGVNPIGGKNRVGRDSCWTGCAVPLVPRSLIVRVYVQYVYLWKWARSETAWINPWCG